MPSYYPRAWADMRVYFDDFHGDGSKSIAISTVPTEMTVHLNGYRQADTFDLAFDARHLPLSPELIRAIGVQLYLFQTERNDEPIDKYITDENLVLTGIMDDSSLSYSADGGLFSGHGRDYTALLIDKQWPTDKAVPLGSSLGDTINKICEEAIKPEPGRQLSDIFKVVFEADEDQPEVTEVSKATTKKKVTVQRKTRSHKGKGIPQPSGRTYWDVIYLLALEHGYIAFFRGNELVLAQPKAIDEEKARRAMRLAYGRNLASLNIERKMGREIVPQVIASAYDAKERKIVEATWPRDAKKKQTGAGSFREEVRRIVAPPGVTDKAQLEAYCKAYYHQTSRREATIKWETIALRDLAGEDMLQLRPGDPTRLSWDSINDADFREKTSEQRLRKLRALGYGERVAQFISERYEDLARVRVPFYTRDVSFRWSTSDGITVSGEGINYVSPQRDNAK